MPKQRKKGMSHDALKRAAREQANPSQRARSLKSAPPAAPPEIKRLMGNDSGVRKHFPLTTGLLDYFPDACCAVSEVSYQGNQKHNPGEPMHHARGKSMDHADCIGRHLLERGGFDGAIRHSAALAWRALALLQEELEREGLCTLPRGAKLP